MKFIAIGFASLEITIFYFIPKDNQNVAILINKWK